MRILVCGGRDFTDQTFFDKKMTELMNEYGKTSIGYSGIPELINVSFISGCARGPDSFIIEYANYFGAYVQKFPADWKRYPKAAGAIRNQQMLDEGKPDLVIAFPGGNGTADMIARAKAHGIKVIEVEYVDE